jgi:hypothetical protein
MYNVNVHFSTAAAPPLTPLTSTQKVSKNAAGLCVTKQRRASKRRSEEEEKEDEMEEDEVGKKK